MFGLYEPTQKEPEHDNVMSKLVQLANELLIENQINTEDIQDWCNENVQMEISDDEII